MDTERGVLKIATVGGIDIKLHWSWALILVLITVDGALGWFPSLMPGDSQVTYWVLGFIAALLLFVSVLLHELSHSFTAKARGLPVKDITLFIFGGVSNIEEEPDKPGDEFLIAVVGPVTSLVIAAACYALSGVVSPHAGQTGANVAAVLQYLALINFALGIFNMIPGFPLDGGRVLRSIIWAITHSLQRATRIAGFIGQLVAYAFIFWGLYQTFFTGNLGGLWIAFIGWFLLNAAQQSVTGTVMKETLRGITVGQVMEPAPPAILPNMTLAHLLSQYILPYNTRTVPVVENDRIAGMVSLNDMKDVPQDQWGLARVGQVMTGLDKLRVGHPQDPLDKAMQTLTEGGFDQLPVVDADGRLMGILTRTHILRWLQIRDELKMRQRYPGTQMGQS